MKIEAVGSTATLSSVEGDMSDVHIWIFSAPKLKALIILD